MTRQIILAVLSTMLALDVSALYGHVTISPRVAAAHSYQVLPLQAGARWLHLLGLTAALGPLLFMAVILPRGLRTSLHHQCWTLSRWGAGALIPAALLGLMSQSIDLQGSVTLALSPGALGGAA